MRFIPVLRLVLIFSVLVALAWQKVGPGVWLQRAYGEWILREGKIPEYEPFNSYSVQPPDEGEEADTAHRFKGVDYLTQVGLAKLTEGLGNTVAEWGQIAARFAILHYALGLVAFVCLMRACQAASGSSLFGAVFAIVGFVPLMLVSYPQDAQLIGLTLFCIFLDFLSKERISWLALLVLPGLWVVWVNADGGFLAGGLLFVCFLGSRVIEGYQLLRNPPYQRDEVIRVTRNIGITFVVVGASLFLTKYNHYGYGVIKLALLYPRGDNIPDLTWWQPLEYSKPTLLCWLVLGFLAGVVLFQVASRRVMGAKYLIPVVATLTWALVHEKANVWFFVIAAWAGAYLFLGIIGKYWPSEARSSWKYKVLLLVLPVVALATAPATRLLFGSGSVYDLASAKTPVPFAAVLKENPEADQYPEFGDIVANYPNGKFTGEIFTGPEQGDYLLAHLKVPTHVMLHSHAYTQDKISWNEYIVIRELGGAWWDLLERYQITLVMLPPKAPLIGQLRNEKNWRILRDDPVLVIAIRTKIPDTWR